MRYSVVSGGWESVGFPLEEAAVLANRRIAKGEDVWIKHVRTGKEVPRERWIEPAMVILARAWALNEEGATGQ